MARRRCDPRWAAIVVVAFIGPAARVLAAPAASESFVVDGGDLEELASPPAAAAPFQGPPAPSSTRPLAFEYSDGYRTRMKIHKYASFATIPLFASQYVVGQKLYDGNGSDGTRSAHTALAVATAALFTVNTVTGAWNFAESRKNPVHRTKRTIHGALMLAAGAGFVATGAMAPESENEGGRSEGGSRSAHRTVAFASMGIATVSYLIMLVH